MTFLKSLRSYGKSAYFRFTFIPAILIVGLSAGAIYWLLFPEAIEQIAVPLHYNIHFGVDRYGAWIQIFTIPFIGAMIILINTLAAGYLWSRDKMLSGYVSIAMLVMQVLLAIALGFIILLNLSYYG
jgi:hypothetical protein